MADIDVDIMLLLMEILGTHHWDKTRENAPKVSFPSTKEARIVLTGYDKEVIVSIQVNRAEGEICIDCGD